MTRENLSDEKKKEYDEIVEQLIRERNSLPKSNNVLDANLKKEMEILNKYLPKLASILEMK